MILLQIIYIEKTLVYQLAIYIAVVLSLTYEMHSDRTSKECGDTLIAIQIFKFPSLAFTLKDKKKIGNSSILAFPKTQGFNWQVIVNAESTWIRLVFPKHIH